MLRGCIFYLNYTWFKTEAPALKAHSIWYGLWSNVTYSWPTVSKNLTSLQLTLQYDEISGGDSKELKDNRKEMPMHKETQEWTNRLSHRTLPRTILRNQNVYDIWGSSPKLDVTEFFQFIRAIVVCRNVYICGSYHAILHCSKYNNHLVNVYNLLPIWYWNRV